MGVFVVYLTVEFTGKILDRFAVPNTLEILSQGAAHLAIAGITNLIPRDQHFAQGREHILTGFLRFP